MFLSRVSPRAEDGVTMALVMIVMLVATTFGVAAFAAANGDLRVGQADEDSKRALAAAEAGLNEYLFHLKQNSSYWSDCDDVPAPAPVNQPWDGLGPEPAWKWRSLRDSTARYKVEILPAPGRTACVAGDDTSVMDTEAGVMRIRSTGESNGRRRSLVGAFRRRGFLDFIYFTDFETSDPTQYEINVDGAPTRWSSYSPAPGDLVTWASQDCRKHTFGTDTRNASVWRGEWYSGGSWSTFGSGLRCTAIQFAPDDWIAGPFHTNDEFVYCGTAPGPRFGRAGFDGVTAPIDDIEWGGPSFYDSCSSGNDPQFGSNRRVPNAPELRLPPDNLKLRTDAGPANTFTGRTTIVLDGDRMRVTNAARGLDGADLPIPDGGVVYVSTGACGHPYRVLSPYPTAAAPNADEGCGDVHLSGTYSKSLTIGAQKDIIIRGNVLRSGDALLGLIANNFIRIYHPLADDPDQDRAKRCAGPGPNTAQANGPGTMPDVEIHAAILSLDHVFTVDNYQCGAKLGDLKVVGAIGQRFRGPVGTGGSGGSGYTKKYVYDDRLRFRSPPHFLDPVESGWRLARSTEQFPAR